MCAVFVVSALICLYLSFLVTVIEAIQVGAGRRMTIALIAVSNNSTWSSRLLCEYHLLLTCVLFFFLQKYLFIFYILISFSLMLPVTLIVHCICCVGEINLRVAFIQSYL